MSTSAPTNQNSAILQEMSFIIADKREEIVLSASKVKGSDRYQIVSSAFSIAEIVDESAARHLKTQIEVSNNPFSLFEGDPAPKEIPQGSFDKMIKAFNSIKQQAEEKKMSVIRIGNAVIIKFERIFNF